MSVSFSINIDDAVLNARLEAIGNAVTRRRPLHAAMGVRLRQELQTHFLLRNSEGNKQGFPSLGFWGDFARRITIVDLSETGGTISIADPAHALGRKIAPKGPITPKEGRKFLAIPAQASAYGHSPRDFSDLHFGFVAGQGFVLLRNKQTKIRIGRTPRKDGSRKVTNLGEVGGDIVFFLRRSVNPPADPRALPPPERLQLAALDEAEAYYSRIALSA